MVNRPETDGTSEAGERTLQQNYSAQTEVQ